MSYTSIQTKLRRLKKGTPLPLGMLEPLSSRRFSFEGKLYLLKDFAFLVSNLVFERAEPFEASSDAIPFITASLLFKNGSRGFIDLISSDFYKTSIVEDYKSGYFKFLKPGKFAFVAENFISLLTEQELIFDGLKNHQSNYPTLLEGTPVLVLKTLVLDSIPLVKVLYGEKIGWTYGALYDKDFCDSQENNNHWF